MISNHKRHDALAKIAAMDPDNCGLIDAIHLAREALASGSPATGNSVQVDQRVDHLDVLLSVDEQFDRFGDRLPDGFDSRVFRYVKDAIAAAKAAAIAQGAIKQEAFVGVVTSGFVSAHGDWRQELVLAKKELLPSGTHVYSTPAQTVPKGKAVAFCVEFDQVQLGRPTMDRQEAEDIAALVPSRRRVVDLFREAPNGALGESDFKNFHRLLCERFEYGHDPVHWRRDQLSLIEWIARQCADSASGVPAERLADGRWKEIAEYQYALRQFPTTPEKGQGALDALAQQWPGFQVAVERHMEKLKAATKRTEFVRPPKNEFRSQAENAIDEGYHAQMDGLCLSDNPYVERCENWFLWRRGCLNAEKDEA